jgi:hypothetical protein
MWPKQPKPKLIAKTHIKERNLEAAGGAEGVVMSGEDKNQ